MGKKSYAELLKDPRWQRKRLQILERDGWKCTSCEAENVTLHVNHRRYAKSGNPWEVGDADLETLCEKCHEEESSTYRRARDLLCPLSTDDKEHVCGTMTGLAYRKGDLSSTTVTSFEFACGLSDVIRVHFQDILEAAIAAGPGHVVDLDKLTNGNGRG